MTRSLEGGFLQGAHVWWKFHDKFGRGGNLWTFVRNTTQRKTGPRQLQCVAGAAEAQKACCRACPLQGPQPARAPLPTRGRERSACSPRQPAVAGGRRRKSWACPTESRTSRRSRRRSGQRCAAFLAGFGATALRPLHVFGTFRPMLMKVFVSSSPANQVCDVFVSVTASLLMHQLKQVHPDVYKGEGDPEALTRSLILAYESLVDPNSSKRLPRRGLSFLEVEMCCLFFVERK